MHGRHRCAPTDEVVADGHEVAEWELRGQFAPDSLRSARCETTERMRVTARKSDLVADHSFRAWSTMRRDDGDVNSGVEFEAERERKPEERSRGHRVEEGATGHPQLVGAAQREQVDRQLCELEHPVERPDQVTTV